MIGVWCLVFSCSIDLAIDIVFFFWGCDGIGDLNSHQNSVGYLVDVVCLG